MSLDFSQLPPDLQAKTDVELAGILPALTARNIRKIDVKSWLSTHLLARRAFNGSDAYEGSLVDLAKSTVTPPELTDAQFNNLKAGLRHFLGYLLEESPTLTTSTINGPEPLPVQYLQLLNVLKTITGGITQAQFDEFYQLGGGRPWKDETQSTIAAARAQMASDDQFDLDWTYVGNHHLNVPVANKNKAATIQGLKDAVAWWEAQ